jgi:hypothetical protein
MSVVTVASALGNLRHCLYFYPKTWRIVQNGHRSIDVRAPDTSLVLNQGRDLHDHDDGCTFTLKRGALFKMGTRSIDVRAPDTSLVLNQGRDLHDHDDGFAPLSRSLPAYLSQSAYERLHRHV